MTSIANKFGNYLIPADGEIEVLNKRERCSRTFKTDKSFRVAVVQSPIHYPIDNLDPDGYKGFADIDLDIIPATDGQEHDFECNENSYITRFYNNGYWADFIRGGKYFAMRPVALAWKNDTEERIISYPVAGITPIIDNDKNTITWKNAFGDGIDYGYSLNVNLFFKFFSFQSKQNVPIPPADMSRTNLRIVIVMDFDFDGIPGLDVPEGVLTNDILQTLEGIFFYDDSGNKIFLLKHPKAWDSFIPGEQLPHDCDSCNKVCLLYNTDHNQRLYPLSSPSDKRFMDRYQEAWEIREDGLPYMKAPSPLLDERGNWNVDPDCYPIKSFKGLWKCEYACVNTVYYPKTGTTQAHIDGSWATFGYEYSKPENHVLRMVYEITRTDNVFSSTIGVLYNDLIGAYIKYPVFIDVAISEEEVVDGGDDTTWYYNSLYPSAGYFSSTDATQRFGKTYSKSAIPAYAPTSNQFRFASVPIPNGATIDSAILSFKSYSNYTANTVSIKIYGQDEDTATQYSSAANYYPEPGNIPLTTANIDWTAIGSWTINTWYDSPDVKTIIQEVIDRPGWAQGYLGFKTIDNGSSDDATSYRLFFTKNGGSPPQLNITYTPLVSKRTKVFVVT